MKLPVLYIHGTADDVVPFAMGRALFEQSSGRKTFLPVEGAGHEDNARVEPARVRAAISELLGTSRPGEIARSAY